MSFCPGTRRCLRRLFSRVLDGTVAAGRWGDAERCSWAAPHTRMGCLQRGKLRVRHRVGEVLCGGWLMNAITAQLMSTPTEPYGASSGPVIRSGRVAARLNTRTSSVCRLSRPSWIALAVHRPSSASRSGLYASACRGSLSVGKSPKTLSRSPSCRSASISPVLLADASSDP